jgi:hypothetical protein
MMICPGPDWIDSANFQESAEEGLGVPVSLAGVLVARADSLGPLGRARVLVGPAR